MKNIYFLGECMVELRSVGSSTMNQSFAGDVYNSAVYLKRSFSNVNTSMVTAVGKDNLSVKMVNAFKAEDINTQFVFQHESKVPGMYLIETDDTGERSFTYWRNDSAAKKVVEFLSNDVLAQFSAGDIFFFSGISLAIIDNEQRESFWQKLEQLKSSKVKIVFDPNYRARLWQNEVAAKVNFEKAFNLSDIVMPGVEDLEVLYGVSSSEQVIDFCKSYRFEEVIIKNGPSSVITSAGNDTLTHKITPVTNVVDTTSAGDAFNGVYLGARLNNLPISESVQLAAKAAGTVIQHPGAIIPADVFKSALQ